ncbi:MAG: uracil phosphoribosyltransferase [Wolinella sp.]
MAIIEVKHPLIEHKITNIRDINTDTKSFKENIAEISTLLLYEASKNLTLQEVVVETPLTKTKGYRLNDSSLAIVPILRAGLGMVDGLTNLIPNARIGHIGVYRDEESLKPNHYYCKLPDDIAKRHVFLVDPMLATGGSAIYALSYLKSQGVKKITFLCILAAPEGIKAVTSAHNDIDIFIAKIDERLTENGYIFPGLGDAGDRVFGTK